MFYLTAHVFLSSTKKNVCSEVEWKYDTGRCIDASPLIVCNRLPLTFIVAQFLDAGDNQLLYVVCI
jgi:hypothetical protein